MPDGGRLFSLNMEIFLLLLLVGISDSKTHFSLGSNQRMPGMNEFKLTVRTSECANSGSDGDLHFWFYNGSMADGTVRFAPGADLLGPFTIHGMRSGNLEQGTVNYVISQNAGGHLSTIHHSMKLLIIKKDNAGLLNSIADGWRPESFSGLWQHKYGTYEKEFQLGVDCDKGWINSNDYYMVNSAGQIGRLKDSEDEKIDNIVSNRFKMDITWE
uniref:DBH-like monooxygenase protein 1 n=1 Tax=Steinernema glaseri TaxID=37863 RepID=A0A1I7ZQ36_9BILA